MKNRECKTYKFSIFLLLGIIFNVFSTKGNDSKTLFLRFENYNEKSLEIIINTKDTTIHHKLKKRGRVVFELPYTFDSTSNTFNFTLKKRYLFKDSRCDINDFSNIVYNESNCSKTNTFMIDIMIYKSRAKNVGGMYYKSCCEGRYVSKKSFYILCRE